MVDRWHTDEPFYDIAPPPSGDGIVDVQDLVVLSEHLFEDYRMVAHWKMDETEGMIAGTGDFISDRSFCRPYYYPWKHMARHGSIERQTRHNADGSAIRPAGIASHNYRRSVAPHWPRLRSRRAAKTLVRGWS